MLDIERIKSESRGRWPGIYHELGIEVGAGKHQPCPNCGGKDRFRFTDKNGTGEYFCNQCGHGDGFDLIQKCLGLTFIQAVDKISHLIGIIEVEFKPNMPKKNPSEALNRLWTSSFLTKIGDPVAEYLRIRGIDFIPANIRTCYNCYESETRFHYVAMIAKVMNREGKPISLHRTYIQGKHKADIESPKKLMTATENLKGAAIQLSYPAYDNGILGVAEGIETALSAMLLFKVTTWAVISTSLMKAFEPPDGYRKIIIFGDNDLNYAGQEAAYALAKRLNDKGLLTEVQIPPEYGDWNDVLLKTGRTE